MQNPASLLALVSVPLVPSGFTPFAYDKYRFEDIFIAQTFALFGVKVSTKYLGLK
jgi:hypothetical protein